MSKSYTALAGSIGALSGASGKIREAAERGICSHLLNTQDLISNLQVQVSNLDTALTPVSSASPMAIGGEDTKTSASC